MIPNIEMGATFLSIWGSKKSCMDVLLLYTKLLKPFRRGLDVWDAWSFFKLLDADAGGSVEIEEFLMGCLRLRGQATAIDVGKILQDQEWMIKSQDKFYRYMDRAIQKIKMEVASLYANPPLDQRFRCKDLWAFNDGAWFPFKAVPTSEAFGNQQLGRNVSPLDTCG